MAGRQKLLFAVRLLLTHLGVPFMCQRGEHLFRIPLMARLAPRPHNRASRWALPDCILNHAPDVRHAAAASARTAQPDRRRASFEADQAHFSLRLFILRLHERHQVAKLG